ncbi:cuticle protein 18.6-like [Daphnia pulex]|uniref:cuticle protein 18.6-like n=1 Tax=Daphnia pulex TaxID=6669 RepID=UPI001EDFEF18|nr:cuticle protein 18.6-like [Daphnia pulex]XP_046457431.1 cuticle protein 18.6-like [Daphnia pulex]XP_046457432.1 cuticle protein 18.6-like [Daphnia pulex]
MKFFIFAALVSVAVAKSAYTAPSYAAPATQAYSAPAYSAPMYSSPSYETHYVAQPYNFDWAVKEAGYYNDNLDYSHSESSDGKVTTGTYHVVLPDGRTQIVTYRADSYGYVANVKYEGEAKYPEYKPASYATPSYSSPRANVYSSPVYNAPTMAAPVYSAPAQKVSEY